jgi:hypothetical protein
MVEDEVAYTRVPALVYPAGVKYRPRASVPVTWNYRDNYSRRTFEEAM